MQANVAVTEASTIPVAASNIIRGPWPTQEGIEDTTLSIQYGAKAVKANHVVDALLTIVPILFHNIEIAGFDLEPSDVELDCTLITEAIKSMMMKQHGLYHPLQDVAANLFITDDVGDVTMVNSLDLNLGPCDDTAVVIVSDPQDE